MRANARAYATARAGSASALDLLKYHRGPNGLVNWKAEVNAKIAQFILKAPAPPRAGARAVPASAPKRAGKAPEQAAAKPAREGAGKAGKAASTDVAAKGAVGRGADQGVGGVFRGADS